MKISNINSIVLVAIFSMFFISPAEVIYAQNLGADNNYITQQQTPKPSRFNHIISGSAYFMPDSIPFESLILSFSDIGDVLVDENGNYTIEVPRHWTGTATPHLCTGGAYTFDPPQIEYDDVLFDFSDQNYSGTVDEIYTISGKFTDKYTGEPLANKQVTFKRVTGAKANSFNITTNEFGEYSFERLPCWSDNLDPKLNGNYYFEPFTREYNEISSNMPNQDYTFINYDYPVPPGWETISTGIFAIIAIDNESNPNICGETLAIGDLIGVFYEDDFGGLKCGGFGRWQNENNVAIMSQGDDNYTDEKDGFGYQEEYKWKVYSYQHQGDYPAEVELSLGTNKFISLGTTIVDELDANFDNNILLPQGWSGVSSFTIPGSIFITNIMNPIIDELIIIQDMEKMYYPEGGINNMYIWNSNKGYKIKVSEETTLPMNGCPEENKTVNLTETWNLLPVISNCDVATSEIIDQATNDIIIIKEIAGTKIFWPEFGIQTLDMLKSGRAYYCAVSQNTSVTYSDCESIKSTPKTNASESINLTFWNNPVKTGSTHSIAFSAEALETLTVGDYIGAFTKRGICAGLAQITNPNQNIAITIFGNDNSTAEIDGFIDGENINFRIFKSQLKEEISATVDFDIEMPSADGKFRDNGLSAVKGLKLSPAGFSAFETSNQIKFYPNPTTGLIEFSSESNEMFHITIQNMNGQIILNENIVGIRQYDFSDYSKGIYVVKLESKTSGSIKKLILK